MKNLFLLFIFTFILASFLFVSCASSESESSENSLENQSDEETINQNDGAFTDSFKDDDSDNSDLSNNEENNNQSQPDNTPIPNDSGNKETPDSAPQGCNQGEIREGTTKCGFNGNGVLKQQCTNGVFADMENTTGNCSDPDKCPDQFTQVESCGTNNKGVRGRICLLLSDNKYDFSEWGECVTQDYDWDYSSGMHGFSEGFVYYPQWIDFDGAGNAIITEPGIKSVTTKTGATDVEDGPNRIDVFSESGKFVKVFAKYNASSEGKFDSKQSFQNLEGIAVDRKNKLIFVVDGYEEYSAEDSSEKSDIGNHRILKFDLAGNFIAAWGEASLSKPIDIAVDSQGFVFVSDTNSVKKFDSNGSLQTSWGINGALTGNSAGKFNIIKGIAIDSSDNLFVANNYYCSVDKFDKTGKELMRFGHIKTCAMNNYHKWFPVDVALAKDGSIWITMEGYFVGAQKYDASGKFMTEVAQITEDSENEGLFKDTMYYSACGIAIADDGRIFVTDPARGIYIYKGE